MTLNWTDTRSMEEYGEKVALAMATLRPYLGKTKEDVKKDFGEPMEIEHREGAKSVGYQIEKVQFDEMWEYSYKRGMPMINAESSVVQFFFKDDQVVAVDTF